MIAVHAEDRLARGRATVEEGTSGVRIVIPNRRNAFIVAFLLLWLAIWVGAGVSGLSDGDGEGVAAGAAILAVGFLYGAGFLVWMLAGREVIELGGGRLVVSRGVGPVRRRRDFDLTRVEDLRALDESPPWWMMFDWFGARGGTIAFDYGARTYKLGSGVDRAEARQLVRRLQEAPR